MRGAASKARADESVVAMRETVVIVLPKPIFKRVDCQRQQVRSHSNDATLTSSARTAPFDSQGASKISV